MLLVVTPAGATWVYHVIMFKVQVSTFERNIVLILRAGGRILYKLYITDAEKTCTYRRLVEEDLAFSHFFHRLCCRRLFLAVMLPPSWSASPSEATVQREPQTTWIQDVSKH